MAIRAFITFSILFFVAVDLSYATPTAVIRGGTVIRNGVIAPVASVGTDPCAGTPAVGTQCERGPAGGTDVTKLALYAGIYNGYKYMTTPSGCGTAMDSVDTCDGGVDIFMNWASGAPASNNKIIVSPSTEYGGSQSATIAATIGAVAAKFCETLKFGGYDDWYLPAGNNVSDCTNYSGELYNVLYKNSNQYRPNNTATCDVPIVEGPLSGFVASIYWSSVESSNTAAWYQRFNNGNQGNVGKTINAYVRCVRRY